MQVLLSPGWTGFEDVGFVEGGKAENRRKPSEKDKESLLPIINFALKPTQKEKKSIQPTRTG